MSENITCPASVLALVPSFNGSHVFEAESDNSKYILSQCLKKVSFLQKFVNILSSLVFKSFLELCFKMCQNWKIWFGIGAKIQIFGSVSTSVFKMI